MATEQTINTQLLDILSRLEPGDNLDESLRKLLIQKVRRDLTKYRVLMQRFENEYGMDFFSFKDSDFMKMPSEKTEQDYFDWEMAVTLCDEREETLGLLKEQVA